MLYNVVTLPNIATVLAAIGATELSIERPEHPHLRMTIGVAVVIVSVLLATTTHDSDGPDPRLPFTRVASIFNTAIGVLGALHPLAIPLGILIQMSLRGQPDPHDPSSFTGIYEIIVGFGIGLAIPSSYIPEWLRRPFSEIPRNGFQTAHRRGVAHKSVVVT